MGNRNFPRLVRLAAILILAACSAFGTTLDFACISNNSGLCAGFAPQMEVEVINYGVGEVQFRFNNNGPMPSNVTEIYWHDTASLLQGFGTPKYVASGSGVVFDNSSVNPSDLPGGNTIVPPFVANFAVDSANGNNQGINPGEWLKVLFLLQNSKTYNDVVNALEDGSLRIGIHVRSIGTSGQSDALVNLLYEIPPPPLGDVPEPATMALAAAGLAAVAACKRRRS